MAVKKPTPKQALFAKEYLIDLNATQAAIRAGYSKNGAAVQGHALLRNPNIQQLIQRYRGESLKRLDLSADKVLQRILDMADFDMRKLFDAEGNLVPITEWDDDTARIVAAIDVSTLQAGDNLTTVMSKVKLPDRLRSLEMLGKNLKLFTDKIEHTGNVTIMATDLDEDI